MTIKRRKTFSNIFIHISAYFKIMNLECSWLLMNFKFRSLSLWDLHLNLMKILGANCGLSQLDCLSFSTYFTTQSEERRTE